MALLSTEALYTRLKDLFVCINNQYVGYLVEEVVCVRVWFV